MPKRSFPFNSSSALLMKTHVTALHVEKDAHMAKVYAKTQDLLLKGAAQAQGNGYYENPTLQKEAFKCQTCGHMKTDVAVVCVFCDKRVCLSCSRPCTECGGSFCGHCSVATYDEREETFYCLGCLKS